ncbi:hypothetical protein BABINDRAFT_107758 [Babjeviella inositovora NRRL Y-12698]|uniref:Uncharacterized protein n=1 Tax=Babjeviella inositovora NRRL Y-12698 TaxID=984486 RepID=A0A1E3QUW2_9ASCO|nr:uncharacterized protein BABINDRAFT_107758 [Babjeviella inositovora NRRL Y-12698]ODQ81473.1 hypothetical protein BABINDRAFT_107758 [Babjeviella inositovora NRRL Y-12698]
MYMSILLLLHPINKVSCLSKISDFILCCGVSHKYRRVSRLYAVAPHNFQHLQTLQISVSINKYYRSPSYSASIINKLVIY